MQTQCWFGSSLLLHYCWMADGHQTAKMKCVSWYYSLVLLLQQSPFDMGNSVDVAAVAASDSLLLPDEDKSPHPSEFFNERAIFGRGIRFHFEELPGGHHCSSEGWISVYFHGCLLPWTHFKPPKSKSQANICLGTNNSQLLSSSVNSAEYSSII